MDKITEVETLKDLKKYLNKVPDEVLEHYGVGLGDGDISVVTDNGEDEEEYAGNYIADMNKYDGLSIVSHYLDCLVNKIQDADDDWDECEPFFKVKHHKEV